MQWIDPSGFKAVYAHCHGSVCLRGWCGEGISVFARCWPRKLYLLCRYHRYDHVAVDMTKKPHPESSHQQANTRYSWLLWTTSEVSFFLGLNFVFNIFFWQVFRLRKQTIMNLNKLGAVNVLIIVTLVSGDSYPPPCSRWVNFILNCLKNN